MIVVGVRNEDADDAEPLRIPRSRARVRSSSEFHFDFDVFAMEILRDIEDFLAFQRNGATALFAQFCDDFRLRVALETADEVAAVLVNQREATELEAFFYGINPVVIGLIVGASYSMAQSALKEADEDRRFSLGGEKWIIADKLVAILVGALVATVVINPNPVLEFIIAGVIAVAIYCPEWIRQNVRTVSLASLVGVLIGVIYLFWDRISAVLGSSAVGALKRSPFAGIVLILWANPWVKLFLFMVYTGSFIYGGGLVLIPFIEKRGRRVRLDGRKNIR